MKPSNEILSIIQNKTEADNKFNNEVRDRINKLAHVGDSIMAKAGLFSHHFGKEKIEKYFPTETHWYFDWAYGNTVIAFADQNFIHCIPTRTNEKVVFRIDTDILALSDRDFAKLIRKGCKAFRENEKSQEQFARIKHIAEMKHAINSMQEIINREEAKSKEYSINLERCNKESLERTRASHARRKREAEAKKELAKTVTQ